MAVFCRPGEAVTAFRRPPGESAMIGRRNMLKVLAVVALLLLPNAASQAQDAAAELPTEPILRIETGKHGGLIRRIDTDAANRFAVTASYDKTVRVWSLPEGRLMRVLRLPIDQGDMGKAYAVAISPDGATVAVGGWTAPSGLNTNIFLFDRTSGELKQRLRDLPNVIERLVYSPDGRRLAASVWGPNGIRVFDVANSYQPLPSDTQYSDSSYSAAFDHSGRLVTASYDGFVRLYAADRYQTPIARFEAPGQHPYSAAFSPDGTRVAFGYHDDVVVLSGTDLKELFKPKTAGIPNVGLDARLFAVGWSEDGRYLYAGGYWRKQGVFQVRRWSDGGHGAFVDIPSAPQTIMQILGLKKNGAMLFASSNSFGVIQADARAVTLQGLGVLDLSAGGGKTLRISANGETVQVDSRDPLHTYRFALSRRQIDVDPLTDPSLQAPTIEAAGLSVTNWAESTAPR